MDASSLISFFLTLILAVQQAVAAELPPASKCRLFATGHFSGGLDLSLAEVASGGFWTSGSRNGTYRVVVFQHGKEHTKTATFAQWLSADPQSGEDQEFATAEIARLNDIVIGVVSSVRFIRTDAQGPAVAEVTMRNRYSSEEKTFWLILRGPGDFTVAESLDQVPK